MFNAIICRYHEIAVKGGNRGMFENQLVENLRYQLRGIEKTKISRIRGRVWIENGQGRPFTEAELEEIKSRMAKTFGLESFSPVIMCRPDIEELCRAVNDSCDTVFRRCFAVRPVVTFRIRARRSDKDFPIDSKQAELRLSAMIGGKYGHDRLAVNLTEADVTVGCEIRKEFAFIFYETFRAAGGLPVGSSSPVLALLSGGIDSPAACWMVMKRGCRVDYLTFHSSPYTPPETIDKVKEIADILNTYQRPGRLHICNLAEIQKYIRDACNPRFRTVLYRRMMFRIAEKVARRTRRRALLTGEAVGQVASQTIENLTTINRAAGMLVLRPLIGMDKNETIELARRIGTFEVSKRQVPDSCTVFAPDSPATSVPEEKAEYEETLLPGWQEMLDKIVSEIEVYVTEEK